MRKLLANQALVPAVLLAGSLALAACDGEGGGQQGQQQGQGMQQQGQLQQGQQQQSGNY